MLLACILCSSGVSPGPDDVNLSATAMDLERFKNDLFSSNKSDEFRFDLFAPNNKKCLQELSKIGMGLSRFEMWAIKSK